MNSLLFVQKVTQILKTEDDKPLVKNQWKTSVNLLPRGVPTPLRISKGRPAWQDPSAKLEQEVSGNSRERSEDISGLGKNWDREALQKIINKLLDVRNLKDLHLEHYHMSAAQFKKRTTHLDIPGKVHGPLPACGKDMSNFAIRRNRDQTDHVWVDWEQKNLEISSSLIMGLPKLKTKPLGFLIVLDGATSHWTAYPWKSTFASEVISKLHEWMDTFQMNPKGDLYFRWILRRFAQRRPFIILMIRMHSIECIC